MNRLFRCGRPEQELRDRYTKQGFMIYSIKPKSGFGAIAGSGVFGGRRKLNLELTAEGRDVYPKLRTAVVNVQNRFLRGFTQTEAHQLEDFLQRMLANA